MALSDEDVLEDRIAELRDQTMLQLKKAVGKDIKEQREKVLCSDHLSFLVASKFLLRFI